jgi:hypothetical protein
MLAKSPENSADPYHRILRNDITPTLIRLSIIAEYKTQINKAPSATDIEKPDGWLKRDIPVINK